MNKRLRAQGNQSLSMPRKRESTSSQISRPKLAKEKAKVLQLPISSNSGRKSQLSNIDYKSRLSPTHNLLLNKTSVSDLETTSSQFLKSKLEIAKFIESTLIDSEKNIRKSTDVKIQSNSPIKSTPKSPVRHNPIESVSIREASRIKEWASKAKPEIERMWRKMISTSNGIEPYNVVFASYSVFIGTGNNSGLVKKMFLSRPWWKVVESKESANFIWTQWKDKQTLQSLNSYSHKVSISSDIELAPLICSYKAQIAKRVYRSVDIENLGLQLIRNSSSYQHLRTDKVNPEHQRMHNKLENNECLSNKKELLKTMNNYFKAIGSEMFECIPITFNVRSSEDLEFKEFLKSYLGFEAKKKPKSDFQNVWIVKPGEFTNRGQGIVVCKTLAEILGIVKQSEFTSYIIQKYIEKPLLVHKRKFDIRCYALATSVNGVIQGYFYLDGYLRTTSAEYSVKDVTNPFVHLTNDAIQKHSAEYGRFENGNKLSYRDFQKYLETVYPDKKINFFTSILPSIKKIVKDTFLASFLKIDPAKRMHCMEVLGYDFMIDHKFKPWLIEVNTNPCLELSSPYLSSLIPSMLDNALKIGLDSLFPAPLGQYLDNCPVNRFELIFHQEVDGKRLLKAIGENRKLIEPCISP
jgi:Tubulin-tyrosine ligase family